ncbi:signal peptidase I [Candidatus Contubernalis alkaliaceticus]|uniref:signal peptidase I n=1 Tax=Candidatus Contubernalis alkaliaceticus TaxID=338645 RepID=UPI001F4BEA3B|nr:signal peptidase I [Candidatus Contubernalis alkalaceticus]UNC93470.1 signal peptidase I [Candidatus Contubernalis alkalaceticus]
MRILLVGYNLIWPTHLNRYLVENQIDGDIIACSSESSALEIISNCSVDMVLAHLDLAGIENGVRLMRESKKINPNIYTLSIAREEDYIKIDSIILENEIDDFINVPFMGQELSIRLRKAFRSIQEREPGRVLKDNKKPKPEQQLIEDSNYNAPGSVFLTDQELMEKYKEVFYTIRSQENDEAFQRKLLAKQKREAEEKLAASLEKQKLRKQLNDAFFITDESKGREMQTYVQPQQQEMAPKASTPFITADQEFTHKRGEESHSTVKSPEFDRSFKEKQQREQQQELTPKPEQKQETKLEPEARFQPETKIELETKLEPESKIKPETKPEPEITTEPEKQGERQVKDNVVAFSREQETKGRGGRAGRSARKKKEGSKEKKGSGKFIRAAGFVGNIIFGSLLVVMAVLAFFLVQSKLQGGIPSVAGYQMYVALSGSMNPAFDTGSLVFIRETDPTGIAAGDIITFRGADSDAMLTTHRVVEVNNENGLTFTTRGDANNVNDPMPVPAERLVGRVHGSVPYMGYVMGFAQTRQGLIFLIFVPGFLVIAYELRNVYKYLGEIEHKNKKPQVGSIYEGEEPPNGKSGSKKAVSS